MPITAREAAILTLERFRCDRAWSGAVLDNLIKKYSLDKREAALATRLCLGVLQNSMLCDYYIDFFAKCKLEPKVRDILRLGVYQILLLDKIPERAAVNESVELCKKLGYQRASGLVNAVLRKLAANKESLPQLPPKGGYEYLSVKYSVPLWLAQRLSVERGYDFAEAFLSVCNTPSKLYIQINTLKVDVKDYIRALERAEVPYAAFEDLPDCIMLPSGNVTELPGFEEGLFYVQDRAAREAVELAEPEAGMSVFDACSAPGGKAFAAAMKMGGKGSILCGDIHEKKLALVSEGARRLGIDIISTRAGDARVYDEGLAESFDLVIADVPCSGFGVMGKKPEISFKSEKEISGLPKIQLDIINNLSRYIKPCGTLLYATCTVLKDENEGVVERFLEENEGYIAEGMRTFFPNVDGTDGFFAARLKRVH